MSAVTEPAGPTGRPAGRGFWPLRDLPVLLWLFAAMLASLAHPLLPAPRWLLLHLLFLGALTHAVLVWSRHFAETLLHLRPGSRRLQSARLLLHNLGAATVVTGVLASVWALTVAGAAAVAVAVVWHGADLARAVRRALPSRFRRMALFYVVAACFLPVGATLGTLLARDPGDPWHARLLLAHALVNLLGWVGLTVVGTLVTLWPTMLRTAIAPRAEVDARRSLPVLALSLLVAAGGALVGLLPLVALGVAGYLVGLLMNGRGFLFALRRTPPASYASWSALAAVAWLVGCLVTLLSGLATLLGPATTATWTEAAARLSGLVPFAAAGFAAQLLLGALGYLIPVALSGGPASARAANAAVDRGYPLRVTLTNAGLLVCLLPVPSAVLVAASVVVLVSLTTTLPLLLMAVRASRRAKADPASAPPASARNAAVGRGPGLVGAGIAVVALAVALGAAVDPGAVTGTSPTAGITATGETTTVEVTAKDMRFSPETITVPAGNRLVLVVTNADTDVHDLALDTGATTGRLGPGQTGRIDVGVVGRDLEGWCTVVGHRQRGMVLHVRVAGGSGDSSMAGMDMGGHTGTSGGSTGSTGTAADDLDFMADPPPGFTAYDAALPPLDGTTVHRRTITVRDQLTEVAPGVTQLLWTYDGTAPGPVLHGKVGDVFEITLVNDSTIGHSIDFHAGALAPDGPMRTIAPGQSLVYRFQATRAGIWMYHCSTMPMSDHIANGMFGAVVIEPDGLPPVDHSYVLVQSELYLGPEGGTVDAAKVAAETPDAVVFNGYADQYDHDPLTARVGERVRIWVLDAGPSRSTSFHVVGGQFDTVWSEGAYLLDRRTSPDSGSQALALAPAQGGFVELSFGEAGSYPFVSHVMVDAERGAHGVIRVTP